jgi:predicted TIM-barrel fold metal-dependent hydrolase
MRGIDVHVHVPEPAGTRASVERQEMATYFGMRDLPTDPADMVATYERLGLLGCIFSIDTETVEGGAYCGNDYVADIADDHPDRFIGFASVDPWKGEAAVAELERSVRDRGLRGLKMHPSTQRFFPNDPQHYPLWAKASELGIPILFHTGQTGVGTGQPGGKGVRFKYAHPMLLDDVAADFPDLTIIMAHPAVPWQEEQLAVVLHKGNVFMDLSGWSPKYFRPILRHYLKSLIADKALFGSDYPVIQPERWLQDFEQLELSDEAREKILISNAARLLGLD